MFHVSCALLMCIWQDFSLTTQVMNNRWSLILSKPSDAKGPSPTDDTTCVLHTCGEMFAEIG